MLVFIIKKRVLNSRIAPIEFPNLTVIGLCGWFSASSFALNSNGFERS